MYRYQPNRKGILSVFRFCFFLLVIVGLCIACTPNNRTAPPVTLISAVPVASTRPPVSSVTPLPEPASLPTDLAPTLASNPSRTPLPSLVDEQDELRTLSTPEPAFTLLPTVSLFSNHYDLPAWLNDPQTAVLMTQTMQDQDWRQISLSLLNATTGERFDIPLPEPDVTRLSWQQTDTGFYFEFGFISSNTEGEVKFYAQVNVATGEVFPLPTDGWEIGGNNGDGRVAAPNGRYDYRINQENHTIVLTERETGQEVTLADPFNGRYPDALSAYWSPIGEFLAVSRHDFGEHEGAPSSHGLAIYTVTGQLYDWIENAKYGRWAPGENQRLFYLSGDAADGRLPCIWDGLNNTNYCLTAIGEWQDSQGVEANAYEWSPDGSKIGFSYWGNSGKTGFCQIVLSSEQITCFINETMLEGPYFIWDAHWSPDQQYLTLLIASEPPYIAHDFSILQLATIAVNGSHFYVWGHLPGPNTLWRPALTP